jgi:TldD protein
MFRIKYILTITFIAVLLMTRYQAVSQVEVDSIIFSSMNDEMKRSIKDLRFKDYAEICYLSYELVYNKSIFISAEIGSISSFNENRNTDWSYRLIVGNNKVNDENFVCHNNSSYNLNDVVGDMTSIFPVEPDYFGLRRAFWLKSNSIYKSAGANHKEKLKLIENEMVGIEPLPYDDFANAPNVNINMKRNVSNQDTEKLRQMVRSFSNLYYEYPELSFSEADINLLQNDVYYLNSDGSYVTFPMDMVNMKVGVMKEDDQSNTLTSYLTIMASSPGKLPTKEELKQELSIIAENVVNLTDAEEVDENYNGPVLYCGQITAEVLMKNLFKSNTSLFAERNNLIENYDGKVYYEETKNKWQSKLGKKILPSGVKITARPKLKTWEGKELFGSFLIDSDGVIPPDSVLLVENGILQGFLSSRTPSNVSNKSNGHFRFTLGSSGLGHLKGPSVTIIESTECKSESDLKNELIKIAKEEGLDYALIIRSLPSDIARMPYNYYKVDLETGEETLVGNFILSDEISPGLMKKIQFSKDTIMVNTYMGNSYFSEGYGSNRRHSNLNYTRSTGLPISYIGPKSMLVTEVELNFRHKQEIINLAEDFIKNPLVR